jgi:hypothetical protein
VCGCQSRAAVQVVLTETPACARPTGKAAPAPAVEGPTALAAAPEELSIATFNIENFPGDGGAATDARLATIAEIVAKKLKGPNVLAMQEQQVRRCLCAFAYRR